MQLFQTAELEFLRAGRSLYVHAQERPRPVRRARDRLTFPAADWENAREHRTLASPWRIPIPLAWLTQLRSRRTKNAARAGLRPEGKGHREKEVGKPRPASPVDLSG